MLLVLMFSLHWVRADSSLVVGSAPGFIGATVAVPVTVSQPTNIVAAQFEVSFDPTRVTPGAVTLPSRLTNHVVASREIAPGVWRVLVYSPVNAGIRSTNRSVVANLPFTLAPQERSGSGPLTPNNVVVARSDGTAVAPLGRQAGSIFIAPVHQDQSGEVTGFFPSEPDERYLIQATTDFLTWVNIATNLATGSFMDFVDQEAAIYPFRFYRTAPFSTFVSGHLDTVALLNGGQLRFKLTGLAGRSYTIQASTNLVQWVDLGTQVATGGALQFTNQVNPAYPTRFYRLKSQ